MSITFPAAHAAKAKLGNVKEDWLILLGYDEAFDLSGETLDEAVDISETDIDVSEGNTFSMRDYIRVDNEVMYVSLITSDTLTVVRGAKGTTAATHNNNTVIYFDLYIPLAGSNRIVNAVQFYGIIQDFGEIEQSLDLAKSKASTASGKINCLDTWKGSTLSAELYGGSKKYINRRVKIYSCLNDEDTLSNCALLFEGKFIRPDLGNNIVTLIIEQWTPFDNIMIPNTKNNYNDLIPVVYGDYSPELSASGSENYLDERALHPTPIVNVNGLFVLNHVHGSITSNANPHHYESDIDGFAPMENADNVSEAWHGSNIIRADLDMERSFKFAPNEVNSDATPAFTNPGNAYTTRDDRSVSNTVYASESASLVDADSEAFLLYLRIPQLNGGKCTSVKLYVNYAVDIDSLNGVGSQFTLYDQSYGTAALQQQEIVTRTSAGQSGDDTAGTWFEVDWYTANRYQSGDRLPDQIKLVATFQSVLGGDIGGWVRIYDVYVKVTVANEITSSELVQTLSFARGLGNMFCGGDGNGKDYTDGGGAVASLAHEVHRDLMNRYAGFDYDNDYMANWTALNTARAGWTCLGWVLNPIKLKSILEQVQFEGCFIFLLTADSDGSGNPGGKYVWVKDSYSSGDVVQTLSEKDYEPPSFKISVTDFKDWITKTNYNFQKHPAKDSYFQSLTHTNSTTRTDYNITETNENVGQVDLDFLVNCGDNTESVYDTASADGDNAPNESIVVYYDSIIGKPRIMIQCEMINIAKSDIELGDIIQFNDSNINPYGKTWSDLYFMIVELRRTKERIQVTAREVYEA